MYDIVLGSTHLLYNMRESDTTDNFLEDIRYTTWEVTNKADLEGKERMSKGGKLSYRLL